MTAAFDIIIVGAGIAGSGLAWTLSPRRQVLVLEQEHVAGYHTTGRSAAFYSETYGGPLVQPLSTASRPFLMSPPTGFTDTPLMKLKEVLLPYTADQLASARRVMDEMKAVEGVRLLDQAETLRRAPCLRPEKVEGAVLDPSCGDLDVSALHQAYMKGAKASGAQFLMDEGLEDATYDGVWTVRTRGGQTFTCDILVNAAGAWADDVGVRSGVAPLGLVPKRRTLATAELDKPVDIDWPVVIDIDEQWYFRVEGDRMLITPADATPTVACDAQPEEMDVALAAARFEEVSHYKVKRIDHKWAGLRTFAADNAPVIGFDAQCSGFFWSVGQGGWGIQTSPAWADLAANMILAGKDQPVEGPPGAVLSAYSPDRF